MKKQFTKKLFALLGALLFLGVGAASARDIYLVGGMNEWSKIDSHKFSSYDDNHYYLNVKLGAGTYKFKIFDSDYWSSKSDDRSQYRGNWDSNGDTYQNLSSDWQKKIISPIKDLRGDTNGGGDYILVLTEVTNVKFELWDRYWENNANTSQLWVKKEDYTYPDYIYIHGYVSNNDFTPDKGGKMVGNNGVYSGVFKFQSASQSASTSDNNSYFSFTDNLDNSWIGVGVRYGATDPDELVSASTEKTYTLKSSSGNNGNSFKITPGKYTVTVDLKSNEMRIESYEYPENLYIYGDLKGDNWHAHDYYVAKGDNGIYVFPEVSIRKEDPNARSYVAFFSNMDRNTDDDVLDFNATLPRYGAADWSDTPGDSNDYINDKKLKTDRPLYIVTQLNTTNSENEHNFELDPGMYRVEVNLANMTVKFIKIDLAYRWYTHDNKPIQKEVEEDETSYKHVTTYNVDNKVQLAVLNDVRHPAADAAEFEISYNPSLSEVSTLALTPIEAGKDYDDYSVDNNYVLTLKKAGTYTLKASLPDDLDNVYQNMADTELQVLVQPMSVSVKSVSDQEAPFNFSGGTTFNQILNFDKAVSDTEYTITVVPNNEAQGWPAASSTVTMETALKAVVDEYSTTNPTPLWTGYEAWGQPTNIDGFFTSVGGTSVKASEENASGYYTYDVTVNVPCSGLYTMTLTPGNNITFAQGTQTEFSLSVYPNLYGSFDVKVNGKDDTQKAFDLNGYTAVTEQEIKIPNDEKNLDKAKFYTPGIYFAESFSVSTTKPTSVNTLADEPAATATEYDYSKAPYVAITDISSLASGSLVYATISKNGASHTFDFTINKTTDGWGTSTGVEAIGTEDGEAVYYNLQGVRVDNPDRGIYVKVVNGKAVKVIRNEE